MAKCRVFQNPDGSVRVMYLNERRRPIHAVLDAAGRPTPFTDEEFFAAEAEKQPELKGLPFEDVDVADIPKDRQARARWRLVGRKVVVALE